MQIPDASFAPVSPEMSMTEQSACETILPLLRKKLFLPAMKMVLYSWSAWTAKALSDDSKEGKLQRKEVSKPEHYPEDERKERNSTCKKVAKREIGPNGERKEHNSPRKEADSSLEHQVDVDRKVETSSYEEDSSSLEGSSEIAQNVPTKNQQASDEQDATANLLTDEAMEGFFQNGASCELMDSWAKMESEIWHAKDSDNVIPSPVRSVTLKFMQFVARDLKLPPEAWYEMVVVFDLYILRASRNDLLESLVLVSGGVIRLIAKLGSQYALCSDIDALLQMELPKLANWFVTHGYLASTPSLSDRDIDDMEKDVLTILEWRINLPTVMTWSRCFLTRFSVLTQQKYKASLHWLWVHMATQLDYFVQEGLSPDLAPQQLAMAFFVLGLASANLIPLNVVFEEKDVASREAFLSCQPDGAAIMEDASNGPLKLFCQLLEISTTASIPSLQRACRDIVDVVAKLGKRRFSPDLHGN